jgi:hypothetical protein
MRGHAEAGPQGRLARATLAATAACLAMLYGCVSYSGSGLKPGQSTLQDVLATMGEPAERWQSPDGSIQLSYPRGPAGYHSYMVELDAAGRLQRIRNVMDEADFNRVSRGMTEAQVLRTLGPSVAAWTNYFPARRELVWEWRYCDQFGEAARFDVLFDADRHDVRATMSWVEVYGRDVCLCGR